MRVFPLLLFALFALSCASTPLAPLRTERGREVQWRADRFPLEVAFVPFQEGNGGPQGRDALCRERILHFAREFNRVAGRPLFRAKLGAEKSADVVIVSQHRAIHASTALRYDNRGTIHAARIAIPCLNRSRLHVAQLIAHEMLHALGFDHNTDRYAAVMHAIQFDLRLPNSLAKELRPLADPDGSHIQDSRAVIAVR